MYDGIDRMDKLMTGLSQQQKVITNNIANTHTPGYVRQSYSFTDVLEDLHNPFENNLSHKMGSMKGQGFAQLESRPVNLAQELIDMQKVFLNYSMVSRRASTVFGNLRRATQLGR